jgi:hypothetical protein
MLRARLSLSSIAPRNVGYHFSQAKRAFIRYLFRRVTTLISHPGWFNAEGSERWNYREFRENQKGSENVVRLAHLVEDIERYFTNLGQVDISKISPHLVINLDETSFSASKSGKPKLHPVVVPQSLSKSSSLETVATRILSRCCARISASDHSLMPDVIVKKERSCFCHSIIFQ